MKIRQTNEKKPMKIWLQFAIAGAMACNHLSAETMGIINGAGTYVALLDNSFALTSVPLPGVTIGGVAMNSSGNSVMGGTDGGPQFLWAGLVSTSGQITQFSNNDIDTHGGLGSVAINTSGNAFASGNQNGFVCIDGTDPYGNATFTDGNSTTLSCRNRGFVFSAAMNNSGWGVFGGNAGQNLGDGLFVKTVAPGSYISTEIICSPVMPSYIDSVAINNVNAAIAGGYLGNAPYAVLFTASDSPPILTQVSFPFTQGQMKSVSIADSGTALVGGVNTLTNVPFAALVDPSGQFLPPLSGSPIPSSGVINSVDLVDGFGYGVIAGQDTTNQAAYFAYVDILGNVHPISG